MGAFEGQNRSFALDFCTKLSIVEHDAEKI